MGRRLPLVAAGASRHASRDCSDHSSMKPGEACWLNSAPPDSNVASWAS